MINPYLMTTTTTIFIIMIKQTRHGTNAKAKTTWFEGVDKE
jgi:hypothetical protein